MIEKTLAPINIGSSNNVWWLILEINTTFIKNICIESTSTTWQQREISIRFSSMNKTMQPADPWINYADRLQAFLQSVREMSLLNK
jgi:hypothetical protein